MACVPATAEELKNWSFDQVTNELTFSLPDTILPEFFLLAEPPRLILDIPETEIGDIEPDQTYNGDVQNIRVAQYSEEKVRVVIELTPDIILAPEQADIQFDDHDGQRHWRFRPSIDESHTVAAEPVHQETHPTLGNFNHSAANLAISKQPSETTLPIDPYDTDTNNQVVSVPPLEDRPDLTENIIANESEAPEVPPMVVPSLGESSTQIATTSADIENGSRVSGITHDASLPELAANGPSLPMQTQVEHPQAIEATRDLTPEIPATVDDALTPVANATSEEVANETATVATNPEIDEEATPASVAVKSPGNEPAEPSLTHPIRPIETALAPVEEDASANGIPVEENPSPNWETVQQPAAQRTIVQTTMPAPLTFGQPLPENSP
ncbi:MAG: AMIN domain-containing protein [Cyanobacteria bacterium P01_D01_bin.56]